MGMPRPDKRGEAKWSLPPIDTQWTYGRPFQDLALSGPWNVIGRLGTSAVG